LAGIELRLFLRESATACQISFVEIGTSANRFAGVLPRQIVGCFVEEK
jgi:hypothetical protein